MLDHDWRIIGEFFDGFWLNAYVCIFKQRKFNLYEIRYPSAF